MSVVLSNEDLGSCRRQLKVEVPAPAVEAESLRVTQEFQKRARIKGFRRGKVPLELVRKRFHDEIHQEVVERLVPRYWRQAQAEAEIDPLLPPEVSDVELEPGQPLTFAATVEVRPEIELGDIDNFELPEPVTEPAPEEIERALDDLRRGLGEWRECDRAAARGDLVEGALAELAEEGEGDTDHVRFEVGDANIWEELSLAVTGLAAGAETSFTRAQEGPEGSGERRFGIRVEAVKERELPPLDDELAARVGKFEDVAALRQAVTERLRQDKELEARRQRERVLFDQLTQRHPIELPERVVRHEVESLLREYAGEMARRGVDPEKAGFDWQRLAEEFTPQARRRVQTRLLLDAVALERQTTLSESEFEGQLAALARARGETAPALRKALDREGRLEELRRRFVRGKVIAHMLGDDASGTEE